MILKCGCANMFDMKKQLIPRYAYLPIVVCIVWNTLVYNMTRFFTNKMTHYDFSIKLDSYIPFVSSFVVIYILSYVLWIIGFLVFAKESRSLCNELFAAEFVCKTICLFCSYFPTFIFSTSLSSIPIAFSIALMQCLYTLSLKSASLYKSYLSFSFSDNCSPSLYDGFSSKIS